MGPVRLIHRDGIPYLIKMEMRYDVASKQKVWKKKKGPGLHPLRMTSVQTVNPSIFGYLAVNNGKPVVVDPKTGEQHKIHARYNFNLV